MNIFRFHALFAFVAFVFPTHVSAKPPAAKEPKTAVASPTPDKTPANQTASWLLEQSGGKDAITFTVGEIVRAATSEQVMPFDPANPADAAFLAKLSAVMDRVLPRMNRPDSPARQQKFDEVAACFEDEINAVSRTTPGFTPQDTPNAVTPGRGYPSVTLVDAASGRSYYLSVALYPSGKREEAARTNEIGRAFRVLPGEVRRRMIANGCCLLIGIEFSGKLGGNAAFLNWDVVDVANVPVHAAITFEGDGDDVYRPGAVLTDGRKGSD